MLLKWLTPPGARTEDSAPPNSRSSTPRRYRSSCPPRRRSRLIPRPRRPPRPRGKTLSHRRNGSGGSTAERQRLRGERKYKRKAMSLSHLPPAQHRQHRDMPAGLRQRRHVPLLRNNSAGAAAPQRKASAFGRTAAAPQGKAGSLSRPCGWRNTFHFPAFTCAFTL